MSRPGRLALMGLLLLLGACGSPAPVGAYPGEAWIDESGRSLAPEVIALYADDCAGRQSAAFLDVQWPIDRVPGVEPQMRRYVRDPGAVLPARHLMAPYDKSSSLSGDARFAGLTSGPFQLWIGADHEFYLYLVDGSRVEALPRAAGEVVPCEP